MNNVLLLSTYSQHINSLNTRSILSDLLPCARFLHVQPVQFFLFYAVFGKIMPNNRCVLWLSPPLEILNPPLRGSYYFPLWKTITPIQQVTVVDFWWSFPWVSKTRLDPHICMLCHMQLMDSSDSLAKLLASSMMGLSPFAPWRKLI